MPQRFLKPGLTTSVKWNACSWMAQSFYVRILTLVDDFGRCEGAALLLRSLAFPLHEDIRTLQVQKLGEELQVNQLAVFYKVDGKEYVQLRNWTERARSSVSRFPGPDGGMGRWLEGADGEAQESAAVGSGALPPKSSSKSSSSSKPAPASAPPAAEAPVRRVAEPDGPVVLEAHRVARPNSLELAATLAEFVKVNERERLLDAGFKEFTADEVRQAWNWFEGNKDGESGEWLQPWGNGRRPVGSWLAAMMERIGHNRNIYARRNNANAGGAGALEKFGAGSRRNAGCAVASGSDIARAAARRTAKPGDAKEGGADAGG